MSKTISATPPPASVFKRWTELERQASKEAALKHWQPGQDVWIFGYGSLIWRPEFEFKESRMAKLDGHHRALCLWSRINRGTPELPGLVFGLEQGGHCSGKVFRIAGEHVPEIFEAVWVREMSTGSYLPHWKTCQTDLGEVSALAFIINPESQGYVQEPHEDDLIEIIMRASGIYGPCVDYVMQTAIALKDAGICDERLAKLSDRLESRLRALKAGA